MDYTTPLITAVQVQTKFYNNSCVGYRPTHNLAMLQLQIYDLYIILKFKVQ